MEETTPLTEKLTAEQTASLPEPDCFIDRELSWLQFNLRVLMEAGDPAVPLLERLKYLSIYQNNLDEFFMVRVGSLIHRNILFPDYTDAKTGWTISEELKRISPAVARQQKTAEEIYRKLTADLSAADIEILDYRRISKVDESVSRKIFAEMRQLLSPRIVDAEHPLPFLENQHSYLAVLLGKGEKTALGLVNLSRLPAYRSFELDGRQKIALTDDLVAHFSELIFKKYDVRSRCIFRVTRNADVVIDESALSDDEDLRSSMKKLLRKRNRQQIVRLQICGKPDHRLRELLDKYIRLPERQVFQSAVPFRLNFGSGVSAGAELKFPERHSVRNVQLHKGDFFPYLEKHDLLLSFPYQSITPFIELLYEAADDPEVLSIRITLYRLAASSKLAAALAYAAERGKDVLCLLELRARFDEKNNIDYSEMLEEAGCSVIYGLPTLKVHSKLCLITRKCGEEIRYITQIGTGNYNEVTSEQYCDLSLISANPALGRDAAAAFEALALGQPPEQSEGLITAPNGFKDFLLAALDREIARGSEGFVAIKVNSLNDMDVMRRLIGCSRAGVTVELFVRGICCLLPGLPGLTEHIRVRSVVGRYLEHSRIYVFGTGEQQRIYIGSGDLLNRNTQHRVEAFAEVTTPETRAQVLEVMEAFRQDDVKGWDLQPDGSYVKASSPTGQASQERLYAFFSKATVELPPPAPESAAKKRRRFLDFFRRKSRRTK